MHRATATNTVINDEMLVSIRVAAYLVRQTAGLVVCGTAVQEGNT
jgi:hypothetical protein